MIEGYKDVLGLSDDATKLFHTSFCKCMGVMTQSTWLHKWFVDFVVILIKYN